MLDPITEVHSPHSTSNRAATGTVTIWNELPVNTGMPTVVDLPSRMANKTNNIPKPEVESIIVLLEILSAMNPAVKRPTSIKNQ